MPPRSRHRRSTGFGVALVALVALATVLIPNAAEAGPWTLGAGRLSLKEGLGFWSTNRKFASSLDRQLTFQDRGTVKRGDTIPFDPSTGGTLRAVSIETQAWLGVLDWLDVGVSVPLLALDFDTEPVDTVDGRFGLGDVTVSTQARLPLEWPVVLAVRFDAKLPTGDFDPSSFSVPLTEGQLDLTPWVSAGVSLPWNAWAIAEVGYRFRFENSENSSRPGNETLVMVEVGKTFADLIGTKLAIEALIGEKGEIDAFGTSTNLPCRRLYSVTGATWWNVTDDLALDLGGRWLVAGEDYPTGVQIFTGIRWVTRIFGDASS